MSAKALKNEMFIAYIKTHYICITVLSIRRCNRKNKCEISQRAHNTAEAEDLAESAKQQFVKWQTKKREEIQRLNRQVL